jgi:hypothetical protein
MLSDRPETGFPTLLGNGVDLPIIVSVDGHSPPPPCQIQHLEPKSFLDQYNKEWKSLLGDENESEEDISWDWDYILHHECREQDDFRHFGIVICNTWHALIVLRPDYTLRLGGVGEKGLLVEYLAIAPWHRNLVRERNGIETPRISPLGRWLMWTAIRLSRELGTEGRLCWESKQGAEESYRKMFPNLKITGPQGSDLLSWMEIDQRDATEFERKFQKEADGSWRHTGGRK